MIATGLVKTQLVAGRRVSGTLSAVRLSRRLDGCCYIPAALAQHNSMLVSRMPGKCAAERRLAFAPCQSLVTWNSVRC